MLLFLKLSLWLRGLCSGDIEPLLGCVLELLRNLYSTVFPNRVESSMAWLSIAWDSRRTEEMPLFQLLPLPFSTSAALFKAPAA